MLITKNLEETNSLPIKEAQFKLKNQKDQISTVSLLLMEQEFVRIRVLLSHSCWQTSLNLSQALEIHNVFSLSRSIEEVFSYISDSIKANQVKLETIDSLTHLIFNQVFVNKPIEFKITLKQVEMNLQQIVQEMSIEFEDRLLQTQKKINELEEEIQRLQFNPISKIFKNNEKDMIFKWVSGGKVVSHLELLYRASVHGFQAVCYNLRCDGKGPLVCFIQSQNQRRFGGYIHLKYQKNLNAYVAANPNESFLFSLDEKKQYLSNEINCSYAYYSHQSYGFTMGCTEHDLCLSDNCNANSSSNSNLSHSYGKNEGGTNQSLAGSQSFYVDEVEVFQVIYRQ